MFRILLVDNEAGVLNILSTLLKAEGYIVLSTREGAKALEMIKSEDIDLLVCDLRMSPVDGMEVLRKARVERPDMAAIMLTAYGTVETAVEAMRLGAYDYLTKPFKVDELLIKVKHALDHKKAIAENLDLKAQVRTQYRFENIVAESPAMKRVCDMIEKIAPTDAAVIIYGESGTGKELVARAIHAYSPRSDMKFLAVNCAALPEPLLESEMFGHVRGAFTGASSNKKGLFEAVQGGTILLDEIGAMPISIQGKLLRVLQEKEIRRVGGNETIPVSARVLAATNRKLEDLIKEGLFREDLYYRLSVIPITIEPLRERTEDIMPLVHHVLQEEIGPGRQMTIDPEVCLILEHYPWPGNVRELENAIKHAVTFARNDRITKDTLPPRILSVVGEMPPHGESVAVPRDGDIAPLKEFLVNREQEYLRKAVNAFDGDKEKAAQALKISLATLYRKFPKNKKNGND